jgi:catalase
MIPDNDPNADPRGLAVRFNLGGRKHTDIVTHSTPFFPTRTGGEFLEFLKALIGSPPGTPSPSPVEQFLGSHPKALAFVQAPKPPPSSFSREAYFGVTALKFVSAEGKSTYFRYRIFPNEGVDSLDEAAVKEKGPNYLFEEIEERVKKGPLSFKLLAQLAEEGDVTDDATVHWPEDRPLVELGSLKVDSLVENNGKEQQHIIMDPIPRVQGIEPSDDPLLELRAAIYLISGRQRRAAA